MDHHIYSRRVCIGCLKRAAYLHEKWVSLPVAFPMCPFYLLCQILKPEEWVCRNVGWLKQQNLVFLFRHFRLEGLQSHRLSFATMSRRTGLTVMAVCQQSSTIVSPIFIPCRVWWICERLADTSRNVLTAKYLPLHEPRLYVPGQYDTVHSIYFVLIDLIAWEHPCMHSCLKICALASSLPP